MYSVFVLAIVYIIAPASSQSVLLHGGGDISSGLIGPRHISPFFRRSCLRSGCRHNEVCVTRRRQNICHYDLPRFVRRNCYCARGCLLEGRDAGRHQVSLTHVPHQSHGEFIPDGCTFLVGCRRVCTCHNEHFDCQRLSRPRRRRCRRRRRNGYLDDIRSQCYDHYRNDPFHRTTNIRSFGSFGDPLGILGSARQGGVVIG